MFIWNLKKISSLLGLLIIEQGRQTIAHRQIMSHTVCFCKALKLRVVCIFLKGYKKREDEEYETETVAYKAQNIYHLAPYRKSLPTLL